MQPSCLHSLRAVYTIAQYRSSCHSETRTSESLCKALKVDAQLRACDRMDKLRVAPRKRYKDIEVILPHMRIDGYNDISVALTSLPMLTRMCPFRSQNGAKYIPTHRSVYIAGAYNFQLATHCKTNSFL